MDWCSDSSFVKSHLLPFEMMLLENSCDHGGIRVASKPAELILFTLRTFIKYGSLPDLLRIYGKSEEIRAELRWLQSGSDMSEVLLLLLRLWLFYWCCLFMSPLRLWNSMKAWGTK